MLKPKLKTASINPKKLLMSKWSAVTPVNKEKHYIVTNLIQPTLPLLPITHIEIEAVLSKRKQILPWHELSNTDMWHQGWQ